ncbi:MAG: UDP-N-acetylmuramate dehydrogenase [Methyloprofundus sp.]|nr:UDP-N-acetylmuramate dehydrogenase [Methyloprofundus sp.]
MNMPKRQIAGRILHHEKLAKYTSWRVGGEAEKMFIPSDKADLELFIEQLDENEPVFWLGLGSNLLIRDGGLTGTVINTRGKVKQMKLLDETHLYVECGVPCAHVARFCTENNLSNAEFFAGIPGTMGGALKMNAGAFGAETWSLVEQVEVQKPGQKIVSKTADKFAVGYRSVNGIDDACFMSAILKLERAKDQKGQERIKELLAKRNATQPTNLPSCGSVFRNPENDYAARLIESSELKGYKIGGAEVSTKHANFIVNTESATAADIEQLITYVQNEVYKKQNVLLKTEVCMVGKPG